MKPSNVRAFPQAASSAPPNAPDGILAAQVNRLASEVNTFEEQVHLLSLKLGVSGGSGGPVNATDPPGLLGRIETILSRLAVANEDLVNVNNAV